MNTIILQSARHMNNCLHVSLMLGVSVLASVLSVCVQSNFKVLSASVLPRSKFHKGRIDTVMHRNGCLVFMIDIFMGCTHRCLPGVTAITMLLG